MYNINKIGKYIVISAIVLTACITIVSATPQVPESYWGYATLNGAPASEGTPITVEVYDTGEEVRNTTVQYPNGGYSLDIIFDDPDTTEDEGANEGDALTWKINGINCSTPAPGTDIATLGGTNSNFNLTVTAQDTTPSIITNIANTTPTTDSVTITWDTDEDSDSLVRYGTASGTYMNMESDAAMVTSHSITLTGLSSDTTYYFVVNSTDADDNSNESVEYSFTTEAIPDTTAPVVTITSPADGSTVTTPEIIVSGTAADDSGIASVTVNGELADGTETWSKTITLVEGENTITVVATDNEGIITTQTIIITLETIPPVINSVTLNTTNPNTGDDILVTVNATDNFGVTAVTANDEPLSNADGDDTWEGTITAINGTHTMNISASDAAGNTAYDETASYTATTPVTTLPVVLVEDVTIAPNGYAFTSVMVNNGTDLGSGNVNITFDPSVIQVIDVTSGDGNALTVQAWDIDNTAGSVEIAAWDADESHNGDVVFAHVTLHSVGDHLSSTAMAISSAELTNYYTYEPITHTVATGTLNTIAPIVIIDNVEAAPGEFTTALIMVNNASNLGSGSITVTYNTSVVHVTNVTSGDGNALAVQDWNVDNSTGLVEIAAWDADESHNGNVVFAHVTFHAVGEYPDSTPLAISSSELIDYTNYGSIGHSVTNGTFSIIDNEPLVDAIATPNVILNDNGRPRVPGTNVTVLNATVLDSESGVANVTIDLSPIGGSDDQVMERMAGTDVWTVATTATDGINLTHELVVTATDGANNTNTSVIELTVLLRGDVVRDGNLNSADALYIAKYLVDKEPMPSLLVCDMFPAEGDRKINSADALYLAKYLVGKEAAP